MTHKPYTLVFHGGPLDGKRLRSEYAGATYHQTMLAKRGRHRYFSAVYAWDACRMTSKGRYTLLGKFTGYFSGSIRVRKDGSRMPRKP